MSTRPEISPTQAAATRTKWLAALRAQGHRQCTEDFEHMGKVCALGLLAEVAGHDFHKSGLIEDVGALAGLNHDESHLVADLNDGDHCAQHTFSEIADAVERWFVPAEATTCL